VKINNTHLGLLNKRDERRIAIITIANRLIGFNSNINFNPFHDQLCAIDVVMVSGAPWLRDGLARDFLKDKSGYRKIGGGANTPDRAYFFRSTTNLVYYLKRQGFYNPRGCPIKAVEGMACFFDFDNRGRFNFVPDRSGIIVKMKGNLISKVIMAVQKCKKSMMLKNELITIDFNSLMDRALIGYSDLP